MREQQPQTPKQPRGHWSRLAWALIGLGAAACTAAAADPGGPGGGPDLPPAISTSTTAPCRNSHDPACGEFRYDPEPVNQEMTVDVTFGPAAPKVGEEVVFTVAVRDDGPAAPGCVNYQTYGEADEEYSYCTAGCLEEEPRRHGPWDPPPPENSAFTEEFRHTYTQAATFTATFVYNAGEDCSGSPYRSRGEGRVEVPVSP